MELLKNIKALNYNFDSTKNVFLKKKNKSDFYISKDLLTVTDILEKNNIEYQVDKDNNIIILSKC